MKKPKENPIFAIAADNWMNDVMSLHKEGTSKLEKYIVARLTDEFGYKHVQGITKSDIQKFVVMLAATNGASSIRNFLTVFRSVMEYADDDWDMPLRIKLPKGKKPSQPYYSFEEVRKILSHCMGIERTLFMTLAETGCRVGEAVALQTADIVSGKINISKNVYRGILQDTPKTDSSIRTVSISGRLEDELRKISFTDNPKMFVFRRLTDFRPYCVQTLTNRLQVICKNAGVEYKGTHAFRRGNITELLTELEIPERIVGARVGHLSQGVTLGIYCKVKAGSDEKWVPSIEKWLYEGEL